MPLSDNAAVICPRSVRSAKGEQVDATKIWFRGGVIVGVAAILLATAACSSKASDADTDTAEGLKVGPGVTDTTITLGVLTDLSGPYSAVSKQELAGSQLYWDTRNVEGGVCGRSVELEVQDHGFSPQDAVALYTGMRDSVAGLQQSIGSPTTAAILDQIEEDSMVTIASSYASSLLANPAMAVPGTPYDIEAINGIDYLMRERGLTEDTPLGVIHVQGEYGEAIRAGVEAAAQGWDLNLVLAQDIAGDTTDMSSALSVLRSQDIHHIVLGTGNAQVVSLASLAKAADYDLTILVTNILAPDALEGPARAALEEQVVLMSNSAAYNTPNTEASEIQAAYEEQNPDEQPTSFINLGFVMAAVYDQILTEACEQNDLSHEGILSSFHQLSPVSFPGVHVGLDFSQRGEPASRETFILSPDGSARGGTKAVEGPFVSSVAETYQPGH